MNLYSSREFPQNQTVKAKVMRICTKPSESERSLDPLWEIWLVTVVPYSISVEQRLFLFWVHRYNTVAVCIFACHFSRKKYLELKWLTKLTVRIGATDLFPHSYGC